MIASSESRNSSKNMLRFSSNDIVHNHYLDEARKKTQERDRNSKTSVMPFDRFQSNTDDNKPKPRSTNHSTRRHRFSSNKTSVVYEKTSPRSDLSWKPTGRTFKTAGLWWTPTRKLFDSCTSKADSESTDGSNVDIPNIHECKQTLDVSAGTSINVQKEQSLDLSVELKSLFGPSFDEYFNGENQVVSKPPAVTTADTSDKRQQQPDSTSSTSSLATTVTADGNFDLSDLSWKPTGRTFKTAGLWWIPTRKLFDSCTSKADSESTDGSNVDIPNIHECKQTMDVSAGTSINVQKEQSLDLSVGTLCNVNKENLRVWFLKKLISQKSLSK
nr:hypothetical protein [Tanacetum cinerariifolium]